MVSISTSPGAAAMASGTRASESDAGKVQRRHATAAALAGAFIAGWPPSTRLVLKDGRWPGCPRQGVERLTVMTWPTGIGAGLGEPEKVEQLPAGHPGELNPGDKADQCPMIFNGHFDSSCNVLEMELQRDHSRACDVLAHPRQSVSRRASAHRKLPAWLGPCLPAPRKQLAGVDAMLPSHLRHRIAGTAGLFLGQKRGARHACLRKGWNGVVSCGRARPTARHDLHSV